MAVRPIDSVWLKRNLNKVFPRECDQLYGMLQLIDEAPTLTPPNEPLTCTGCMYSPDCPSEIHCFGCARLYTDHYRRPPEGEEDI